MELRKRPRLPGCFRKVTVRTGTDEDERAGACDKLAIVAPATKSFPKIISSI